MLIPYNTHIFLIANLRDMARTCGNLTLADNLARLMEQEAVPLDDDKFNDIQELARCLNGLIDVRWLEDEDDKIPHYVLTGKLTLYRPVDQRMSDDEIAAYDPHGEA
jgi:hypothetical protein